MSYTIDGAISADITAAGATMILAVSEMNCGPSNVQPKKYYSLLEAFCRTLGVPAIQGGQINAASMVKVDSSRSSGTVVTMDAAGNMDSNRPKSGYRIDLQHFNTKDPSTAVKGCANFQVQSNTNDSVSYASVNIEPNKLFTPADVINAFAHSLETRRPVKLKFGSQ